MYVQSVGKPQGKVQDPRLVPKLELLIKFFITSRPKGEEIAVTGISAFGLYVIEYS